MTQIQAQNYQTRPNEPHSLQNFEIPLPFGYHMDLDFVRFCAEDTMISEETIDRLKDLRRQRRKQRKTLEALMGIRQGHNSIEEISAFDAAKVVQYQIRGRAIRLKM